MQQASLSLGAEETQAAESLVAMLRERGWTISKGNIKAVDIGEADKKTLNVSDLVTAFGRAAGEQFNDDSILLSDD